MTDRLYERRIFKLCTVCDHYFQGAMNGEYTCPACQDKAAVARPLQQLGGDVASLPPSPITPRRGRRAVA